jgi:membrane-associated phospholipid phosphatase
VTDHRGRTPTLYPVDWVVLAYCLVTSLIIVLLGRPLGAYVGEILFYLSMAGLAAVIIRYTDERNGRWQALLRVGYPAMMFTFFYRMTGGQMFLLFDGFFDWQLVAFEKSTLGVYPTVFMDTLLPNVGITEILSFCYFSYYLMLPVFLISLFVRKDYEIIKEFSAAAALTFFLSYTLFWLYPVEGPRWYFAGQYVNNVDGPVFRELVEFVIDKAAVHGGAMPSSHTGVALVIMVFCFRHYRPYGWLLLPLVVGLAIGTVWGRFHYASDVVVGALIAIFCVWWVWKYYGRMAAPAPDARRVNELRTQDVS